MFDKSFLIDKVVNSLEKAGYEVLVADGGSFDVVARGKDLLLIKILTNIDALQEDQASSLKAVSYFLSGYPIVISVKNNREQLNESMVYSRFDVPVVTPQLFDSMLSGEGVSAIQSAKGRHTIDINSDTLTEKRKDMNFTLDTLAEKIGISKKALYEIENNRVKPSEETVDKLEKILKTDLKVPYSMKKPDPTYLQPKNQFQKNVSKEFRRIGIDNSPVYSTPFKIVGKEKFSVITTLSENATHVEGNAKIVKRLSSTFSSNAVVIARKSKDDSIEGIPIVLESDLSEIETPKELKKAIKEKDSS